MISKTQDTKVTSSVLDPNAIQDDDWNPDMKDHRISTQVVIH